MSFQNGDIFQLDYWKQLFSENILSYSFLINIVDIIVVWYLLYKLLQLLMTIKLNIKRAGHFRNQLFLLTCGGRGRDSRNTTTYLKKDFSKK